MEGMEMLDQLEDIIEGSKTVPIVGKAMIDKDELLDIIQELRLKMPDDLKQAKWVREERTKIISEAHQEAANIIKETEELSMVEEPTKFIPVETSHLEGIGIDTKKFDKGVDDVSRICGQFSALKSVGMSDKDAMEVITNLITIQINNDTIEGNIRVANLQDTLSRI